MENSSLDALDLDDVGFDVPLDGRATKQLDSVIVNTVNTELAYEKSCRRKHEAMTKQSQLASTTWARKTMSRVHTTRTTMSVASSVKRTVTLKWFPWISHLGAMALKLPPVRWTGADTSRHWQ